MTPTLTLPSPSPSDKLAHVSTLPYGEVVTSAFATRDSYKRGCDGLHPGPFMVVYGDGAGNRKLVSLSDPQYTWSCSSDYFVPKSACCGKLKVRYE